jgi:integrase
MADKLARTGLIEKRNAATLAGFLADYFKSLSVKGATATAYNHTARYLKQFFGEDRPLRSIGPAEADQWRQHLKASGLSDATVARRVGVARQMFKVAIRWKLIADNPFADVKGGSQTNRSRMFYVTREMAEKVLDICPDGQWRVLVALARYGGLRIPSEALGLRWTDVDWERGRITIHASKTAHHAGGGERQIPLFPELLPHLREAFEAAEPGAEYVITRYRDSTINLRTGLARIIRRAGLKQWPKLWQNLRSTRETELVERWPLHVVCSWIGNSQPVAAKHYLQVTDEHFESATAGIENALQGALQKAMQQPHAKACNEMQGVQSDPALDANNGVFGHLQKDRLGAGGLERQNVTSCNANDLQNSGQGRAANSDAVGARKRPIRTADGLYLCPVCGEGYTLESAADGCCEQP